MKFLDLTEKNCCYIIRVQGNLDSKWNAYFGSFTTYTNGESWTLLCGESADQSDLMGALQKLHGMGMRLDFVLKTSPQIDLNLLSEIGLDEIKALSSN